MVLVTKWLTQLENFFHLDCTLSYSVEFKALSIITVLQPILDDPLIPAVYPCVATPLIAV